MGDELPGAAESETELEEIELEEIEESAEFATGEYARPVVARESSVGCISAPPGARSSVPPPLPPEAREPRRASTPPMGPPPPPTARGSVPPPSPRSGMYRIEARPAPVPADLERLRQTIAALSAELREVRAQNDRLRLTSRLREDRVRELEREAREQRERCAALEAELARARAQDQGDDLKRIPGIGPGFERALHAIGVTTFRQIAEWTEQDVERVAREIRTVPARIVRGGWIEHARALVEPEPS